MSWANRVRKSALNKFDPFGDCDDEPYVGDETDSGLVAVIVEGERTCADSARHHASTRAAPCANIHVAIAASVRARNTHPMMNAPL